MHVADFVAILGGLLVLSFFADVTFQRTRVPSAVVLMATGILLGPIGRQLPVDSLRVAAPYFGALALVAILFEAGLELDLEEASRGLKAGSAIAAISFFLACGLITLFGHGMVGLPWPSAIALGSLLGVPSGAVVIPILGVLGLRPDLRTKSVIDASLADVLGILGVSLAIELAQDRPVAGVLLRGTVIGLSTGVILAVAIGLLWSRVLRRYSGGRFVEALTLGVVLLVDSAMRALGGASAVAVVTFGVVLANEPVLKAYLLRRPLDAGADAEFAVLRDRVYDFTSQTTFLVRTFFFVFLGLVVDWRGLTPTIAGVSLLFVVVTVVSRRAALLAADRLGFVTLDPSELRVLAALFPRGLVTAVLAFEATEAGMVGSQAFIPLAFASLLLTSLLMTVLLRNAPMKGPPARRPEIEGPA
jgi:cell volume regulation protein A